MLLITILVIVSAVSFYLAAHTDVIFAVIAAISSAMTIVLTLAILLGLITCRFDAVKDDVRYDSIMYQVEHNFYDNENEVGLSKLVEDIQKWNEDLRTYEEGKKNPWLSVFFPKDISDYKYIDMSLLRRGGNNDWGDPSKD